MGSGFFSSWTFWALLSATFAALTAIFAKVGIEHVNSDFATLLRTAVVLVSLALTLYATGQYQPLSSISPRSYLFLALSGLATGASWLCYFRALKLGHSSHRWTSSAWYWWRSSVYCCWAKNSTCGNGAESA